MTVPANPSEPITTPARAVPVAVAVAKRAMILSGAIRVAALVNDLNGFNAPASTFSPSASPKPPMKLATCQLLNSFSSNGIAPSCLAW